MLGVLGITELEERIYRHLIGVTSANITELTEALNTTTSATRKALGTLEARAVISRTAGKPTRHVAVPPDVVADSLLLSRQLEINEARAELGALVETYRRGRGDRGTAEVIEIVNGAEAAATRISQIEQHARHEVIGFIKPPFIAIDLETSADTPLPVLAGTHRIIYDREVLNVTGFVATMRHAARAGEQLRLHPALPMKLLIIDREVAILPLARNLAHATPAIIVVHPSGLLDAALALFEHYWEASLPFQTDDKPATTGRPSGDQRRILSLLLSGATDDVIARQLAVSIRTVERRIRELMDAAGANTRVQLGWFAHANEWIQPENDHVNPDALLIPRSVRS